MKVHPFTVLAVAMLTLSANAYATKHHANNVVVMSPSDTSALAQGSSEAMYLRLTGDGETFLYVEANNGKALRVLDVTNPEKISRVAQVSLPARSAYDFALTTDNGVLIRYRDGSGMAFLNFGNPNQPKLVTSAGYKNRSIHEKFHEAIVLTRAREIPDSYVSDSTYEVFDDSASEGPKLVATVSGVIQELERRSTGTMFLLSQNGVTVVRQPEIEQEYFYTVMWKQNIH